MRALRISLFLGLGFAWLNVSRAEPPSAPEVPAWILPIGPVPPRPVMPPDPNQTIRLAHSTVQFARRELTNRFSPPDWYPHSHGAMPEVVAHGRLPDLFACGYCHTPGGQGRPENAPLAGLPSQYIVQQVLEFTNGARRALLPGVFAPADSMVHEAMITTPAEAQSAAQYFSQQKLLPRVVVRESSTVPRTQVVGSVYTPIAGGGEEPLGMRLIELAQDSEQHENRDEQMRYVAYVPPGSIARGRDIARIGMRPSGNHDLAVACITCHGKKLQGVGLIPPLAGRSPSYLLRQLLAFKTGARSGAATQPMQPVIADFDLGSMIDAVAFAASLHP